MCALRLTFKLDILECRFGNGDLAGRCCVVRLERMAMAPAPGESDQAPPCQATRGWVGTRYLSIPSPAIRCSATYAAWRTRLHLLTVNLDLSHTGRLQRASKLRLTFRGSSG
jgi:hypothetical protein